jgi:NADH-quinone oxidoreductase subunit J
MAETILFYVFALGVLFAGFQVVWQRNPLHAALSLVAAFFFLAGIYVLLSAHLIAVLQVMVYAGAVMVLFVFVIMLLNLKDEELGQTTFTAWKVIGSSAIVITLAVAGFTIHTTLSKVYVGPVRDLAREQAVGGFGGLKAVGSALYLHSVLPFEITSLLLLVAIVGAVIVAKGKI